jgi:cytosolic carboxypeptidase protein 2/3
LYYALTFEFRFKNDDDTVYFAHCYPYTYTNLVDDVRKWCCI